MFFLNSAILSLVLTWVLIIVHADESDPVMEDSNVKRNLGLGDWSMCSTSSQCNSACCSGKYSGGILKCTPLSAGFNPTVNGCVSGQQLLSDWSMCSTSSQCNSACCSGKYSGGTLKCTPLSGGFNPAANGCVSGSQPNPSPVARPVPAPPVARPVAPPTFSFPPWQGNDANGRTFQLPPGIATYGNGNDPRWLPTDGCTGMGGAQYQWELNPACNAHDVCYYCTGTPGWNLNTEKCTAILLANAHAICDATQDWWNKIWCHETANMLSFSLFIPPGGTGDCVNGPHKIPYEYATKPFRAGFPGNVCNGIGC